MPAHTTAISAISATNRSRIRFSMLGRQLPRLKHHILPDDDEDEDDEERTLTRTDASAFCAAAVKDAITVPVADEEDDLFEAGASSAVEASGFEATVGVQPDAGSPRSNSESRSRICERGRIKSHGMSNTEWLWPEKT